MSLHALSPQVFGDSDEEDVGDSQGGEKEGDRHPGKARTLQELEDEGDDEFDFIVDDHGQPIRRRKEDGTYTEP